MKVALIQITVGSNFDENFEKSKKFLNDSLALNPDFISVSYTHLRAHET